MGISADAGAFLAHCIWVQTRAGGIQRVKDTCVDGRDKGGALFPRAGFRADFIFGNHRRHRCGQSGGRSDEGWDQIKLIAFAGGGDAAIGGQTAHAGHQAIHVFAVGVVDFIDLDGHAQTSACDRGLQFELRVRIKGGAITRQGFFIDAHDLDEVNLVHGFSGLWAGQHWQLSVTNMAVLARAAKRMQVSIAAVVVAGGLRPAILSNGGFYGF